MKKFLLVTLLLSGCAGVSQFQAECYSAHPGFKDAYTCIDGKMQEDNRFNSPAVAGMVSEYRTTAQVLEEKVSKGVMSDAEAKLALAEKRAELQERQAKLGY